MITYTGIYDCPADAYHECMLSTDLKHLIKEGKYNKKYEEKLVEVFELISDQKIDLFGVSDKFELYVHKRRDVNKLEIQVLKGDEAAETTLLIAKSDLKRVKEALKDDTDPRKYYTRLHRAIQTSYPGRNTHELTVFEFYTDIEDIKTQQEEIKKEKRRNKRTG